MTFRAPLIQKARDRDYSAAIGAQVGALALALTSGIAPRPFAQTDWPNPSRAIDRIANRVQPDIRGAIRFAAAPTPFAQTDWPNPTAPRRLREGLTVNDSALVGQDQFFGGPGQPPPSRDWPNPVQRTAVRQDFVGVPFARATAPVAPPFAQSDWSLHRPSQARNLDPGQSSAPALRTIIAAPFAQTDWPVPRGRTFPLDGRTLALRKLPGGDALPFRASDWTMPIAAKRGIELLTWAPGLLLSNQPPPVVLTVAFAKASDSAAFQATASDSAAKAGVKRHMNVYEIDTLVKVASAFTQASGTAIDPTTVTLYILDPTGAETTVAMGALSHDGVGVFSSQINANLSGYWTYKFQGAGNVEVTTPDAKFLVQSSRLIPG